MGTGGGSGSKKVFSMTLIANLVYFHPFFTEFENIDPKILNFADLSGWVGPQVINFGHLEKFKSQKSVRKCALMIFKISCWLNVTQEVFQRVKTRDFVTYLQARGSPIITFCSIEFCPPPPLESSCPKKAILEISKKLNFPKMVLHCS